MPLYTFRCPDCRHQEEITSSVACRNSPRACSSCGGQLERQVDAGQGLIGRTADGPAHAASDDGGTDPWEAIDQAIAEGGHGKGGILLAGKNNMIIDSQIGNVDLPAVQVVGRDSDVTIVNSDFHNARTAIDVGDGAKVRGHGLRQTFSPDYGSRNNDADKKAKKAQRVKSKEAKKARKAGRSKKGK